MDWGRQVAFINHFYFYQWDSEWGAAFWTETTGVNYARLVYPYLEQETSLVAPMPLERLCHLTGVRAPF